MMNEWKDLDKCFVPSDILSGKYEFEWYERGKDLWYSSDSHSIHRATEENVIHSLHIGMVVRYRRKAVLVKWHCLLINKDLPDLLLSMREGSWEWEYQVIGSELPWIPVKSNVNNLDWMYRAVGMQAMKQCLYRFRNTESE